MMIRCVETDPGRVGRSPRPRLQAPETARARPRADVDQPHGGPRRALLHQVSDGRRDRGEPVGPAAEARAGGRRGVDHRCSLLVRELPGARSGRPARHHRNAEGHRGARDAPADPLLRLDENRRPHLADHDRRRRHPESGRHRHRAADGVDRVGRACARRPSLSQLEADCGDDPDPRHLRRRDGMGVPAAAAAVPRARQDPRGGDRPALRIARRHPHRQSLYGREARRSGLRQGSAPAVPQRGADDDGRVRRRRLVVAGARHRA